MCEANRGRRDSLVSVLHRSRSEVSVPHWMGARRARGDLASSRTVATMVDVDAMTVSQLRAYLREAGADTASCFTYPPSEASPFAISADAHGPRRVALRRHAPSRRSTVAPSGPARRTGCRPRRFRRASLVRLAKKVAREGGAPGGGAGPSTARGADPRRRPARENPSRTTQTRGVPTPPRSRRSSWRASPAPRTTTSSSASASPRARMRSSARTASSRSSCIPTRTRRLGAEEAFKKVNKAWDVLSDKNKRATYDNFGAEAAEGRPGAGGNPFGGFGVGRLPRGRVSGGRGGWISRRSARGDSPAVPTPGRHGRHGGRRFSGAGLGSADPGAGGNEAGCRTSSYAPSCPTLPSSGDLRHPAILHGVPGAEFPPIGTRQLLVRPPRTPAPCRRSTENKR